MSHNTFPEPNWNNDWNIQHNSHQSQPQPNAAPGWGTPHSAGWDTPSVPANAWGSPAAGSTWGAPEQNQWSQPPASQNEYTVTAETSKHRNVRKAAIIVGGSAILAAVIGGGVYALHGHESSGSAGQGNEQEATNGVDPSGDLSSGTIIIPSQETTAAQPDPGPSDELVKKFETVISGDTCDPVTARAAATAYHEIVEVDPYKDMSNQEVLAHTDEAVADFEAVRSKIEFPALPSNFDKLSKDAAGGNPTLPTAEYQAAIQQQLTALGIDAHFSWEPAATIAEARQRGVPISAYEALNENHTTTPLTQEQWNSPDAKRGLMRTMQEIAVTPKQAILDAELPAMFFGDSPGIAGHVPSNNGAPASYMFINPLGKTPFGTFGHELTHARDFTFCADIKDIAWDKTNPDGFTYRNGKAREQDDQNFTDLITASNQDTPATVAQVSDYARQNLAESKAETAALILNPKNAEELFVLDASKTVGINEKLALIAAREQNVHPEEAAYFMAVLKLAQFEAKATEAANAIAAEYKNKYLDPAFAASENGTMTDDQQLIVLGRTPREGTPAYDAYVQQQAAWNELEKIDEAFLPAGP